MDCPEKKSKDSSGGSSGGFAMMCVEGGKSPVEEDLEQPNLEVNSEARSEEKNLEAHLEQRFLLQDWKNSEIQSPMTENLLCMNEV